MKEKFDMPIRPIILFTISDKKAFEDYIFNKLKEKGVPEKAIDPIIKKLLPKFINKAYFTLSEKEEIKISNKAISVFEKALSKILDEIIILHSQE